MVGLSIVRRQTLPPWAEILLPVAAIFATLIIGALPIVLAGGNLFKAYSSLVYGALGTRFNLLETLVKASPLILTGLAVSFAFRARFWNIGAEGQLFAGAIAATAVGVYGTALPSWLVIPACIVSGFIAGGLWAVLPAFLKTKLKVDDVVTTLLLNYVMIHVMGFLLYGPMQAAGSSWPRSEPIMDAAHYPILLPRSRLHLGLVIAIVMVLAIWFINARTVFGYRSKCVGVNINAAHFSGVNTDMTILKTALISGGLAGLAGVGEVCAIHYHLLMDISPGYGYTGIVIAMLGNLHPVGVALSAFFFSCISIGSQTMSRMAGIPVYIEGVI
ncbi:MAG: ABC transporter permease [Spirochaetes bacterium]|nr:ABC transporter permease [Spirochaetota bacterium]